MATLREIYKNKNTTFIVVDGMDSDGRMSEVILQDSLKKFHTFVSDMGEDGRMREIILREEEEPNIVTIYLDRARKVMNAPIWSGEYDPSQSLDVEWNKIKDSYLVFGDICLDIEVMDTLECNNITLLVCDHHQIALSYLGKKDYISKETSVDKCGAMTVWDTFFSAKPPMLLQYVQDRDLFKKELDNCDGVFLALKDTSDAEFLSAYHSDTFFYENIFKRGAKLYSEYIAKVEETIKDSVTVGTLAGYICLISKDVHFGFVSDVGNLSLKREWGDIEPLFYVNIGEEEKETKYEFRSLSFDVGRLATANGGGGHRLASGCILPKGKQLKSL
jgi:hypothetical protein